jgi:lipopolysaccharide export LptBFGC system permease protein LptF
MLVVLVLVYLALIFKLYFKNKKSTKVFLLFAFIVSMFVLFSNATIQYEMQSAIDNIQLWVDGSVINSSSGLRLEMWS